MTCHSFDPIPADLTARLRHANKNNLRAFQRLRETIHRGNSLALVGAGLSMNLGYPSWNKLLEELAQRAITAKRLTPEEAALVGELDEPLWKAGHLKSRLNNSDFARFIREQFDTKAIMPDSRPRLRTLFKTFIDLPFAHVLTTNYDHLLETAHRMFQVARKPRTIDWTSEPQLNAFIKSLGSPASSLIHRHYVHLHGTAKNARTIVLSEKDYLDRYVRSAETYRKLFAIFATRPVVFIGFGMSDPELKRILRDVQATLNTDESSHFIILPLKKSDVTPEVIRRHMCEVYGVEPVFFPAEGEIHHGLTLFLTALSNAAPDVTFDAPPLEKISAPLPLTVDFVTGKSTPAATPGLRPSSRFTGQKLDPSAGWAHEKKPLGRVIYVRVKPVGGGYYWVDVRLVPTDARHKIRGSVKFILHESFADEREQKRKPRKDGSFHLEFYSYGAFVLQARFEEGTHGGKPTTLRFNLARHSEFPRGFREN